VLALVGAGRHFVGTAPAGPREPQLSHQALDGAARHPGALPVELGPHLVGPIDLEVLGMDPSDLDLEVLVAHPGPRGGRFLATQ
jgi:hypothetical protein